MIVNNLDRIAARIISPKSVVRGAMQDLGSVWHLLKIASRLISPKSVVQGAMQDLGSI